MLLERPTLKQIFERTEQDLGASHLHSTRKIFSKAISGCAHLLYGYARNLANNIHPLWAQGEALGEWAKIWFEAGRKPATPSKGVITVEASDAITLPAGTAFKFENLEFRTTQDVEFSGVKNLEVEASMPGKTRVIDPGNVLIAVQTIPNLISTAIVAEEITGGSNTETDDSLRERILDRVRNPPQGGSPQDYINWAKEVSGISRTWVAPKIEGLGTVGVAFVDDNNGGLPTIAARIKLIDKLEKVAPAATKVIPVMLEAKPIHFTIKISPISSRSLLQDELKTLIKNVSEPRLSQGNFINSRGKKTSGILAVSDIHEILAHIPKDNYKIVAPSTDLIVPEGKIFTFGGLNVQST